MAADETTNSDNPTRNRTFVSPDDANLSSALEITASLMQIHQAQSTDWFSAKIETNLADIVHDAKVFASMVEFAERTNCLLPMFYLPGDDTPLPIRLWSKDSFAPRQHRYLGRYLQDWYANGNSFHSQSRNPDYMSPTGNEPPIFRMEPFEVVKESFRKGLVSFLAARLKGPQGNLSKSGSPGIAFKVSSNSDNLRVYYRPTYWHVENQVFGYPTSPVDNYLQAGRWSFGATGPSLPLTFEPAWYDVPKHTTAHLDW